MPGHHLFGNSWLITDLDYQYVIFTLILLITEFCPGVPWKGLQNIDPETDPNVTPGSVPSGPTINTNIQDVNRYLLRDRSGGESRVKSFRARAEQVSQ